MFIFFPAVVGTSREDMYNKVVLFCFVGIAAIAAPSFGYEFENEEALDCETLMKNERLVNGIKDCFLSAEEECGTVMFTQMKSK